ncbi:MAG: S9 family peptidase [Pseudomonadota bacterium]
MATKATQNAFVYFLGFSLAVALGVTAPMVRADFLEDLAKQPEVLDSDLAPDGKKIAILREVDGQRVLFFYAFPSLKLTGTLSFPGENQVGGFRWVNNERVIASVAQDDPETEGIRPTGELFGINYDGKKSKHLFGYRAAGDRIESGRTARQQNEAASGRIIHSLPERSKEVLIEITGWDLGLDRVVEAARLNVYSGKVSNRLSAPVTNASLIPDRNGNIVFALSTDAQQNHVIHQRDQKTGRWNKFSSNAYGEAELDPLAVGDDGRIFVKHSPDGGPYGIYLLDPKTQDLDLVYRNEIADARLLRDATGQPYGIETMPDRPRFVAVDRDHPITKLTIELERLFPDGFPRVWSATRDHDTMIIQVDQDTKTTEYYLYSKKNKQLALLFDSRPWLNDGMLGEQRPVTVTARDGMKLHGYLTLPRGAEAKNLPLVMVPHGGPHGPRDRWGYPWFEGFIPAAGYAMLQINYRGSGGYGPDFESAGFREWSGKMQNDLTDAVNWAVEEGIADPERLCIFGWSYGGYAAVRSIEREPDLYKCSAAGAGVYDQDLQYKRADFARFTRFGKSYVDRVVGPTLEDRRRDSPTTHVDKIKVPLLLIHGDRDLRVPIEHMYALEEAMVAAGKPKPKTLVLKREAHSPRNPENLTLMWREILSFFEEHIGPGVPVAATQVAAKSVAQAD